MCQLCTKPKLLLLDCPCCHWTSPSHALGSFELDFISSTACIKCICCQEFSLSIFIKCFHQAFSSSVFIKHFHYIFSLSIFIEISLSIFIKQIHQAFSSSISSSIFIKYFHQAFSLRILVKQFFEVLHRILRPTGFVSGIVYKQELNQVSISKFEKRNLKMRWFKP